MTVITKELTLVTNGENDVVNITDQILQIIQKSKLTNGLVTVFIPGSTGALTTIEYEPGLINDFPRTLDRIVPSHLEYEHDKRWRDGNGHSHVKASIIGPSITIPFSGRKATLGTWQQVVFIELDIRPRKRTIVVQLLGE